ncbi:MAG TPA: hypothetical protein VG448_01620 [Solirubrobacterales bacterium]|nr:hypothetical protein [Solirubrobacterales bacterium]
MQDKPKGAKSTSKGRRTKSKAGGGSPPQSEARLRPGQLDGLVLGYMKRHKAKLPLSPTAVARGIKRSSGAVGNCLNRLEQAEKVRLVEKKPRRYGLAEDKK